MGMQAQSPKERPLSWVVVRLSTRQADSVRREQEQQSVGTASYYR